MGTNKKKGISLIVLIITIIVMIILAAAIILSISNSGIMDKANKAKEDSDTASLKEYVNVLEAEWELMTPEERNGKTSVEYVNEKLSKKYPNKTYSADGEIYSDLPTAVKELIAKGLKIGDAVTGYELDSSKTQCALNMVEELVPRIDFTTWRYIGIDKNNTLLIAPDMLGNIDASMISARLYNGASAYIGQLNLLCNYLYSTNKGNARSMNVYDVNRILQYTGSSAGRYIDQRCWEVNAEEGDTIGSIASRNEFSTSDSYWDTDWELGSIEDQVVERYSYTKTSEDILNTITSTSRKEEVKELVFSDTSYWLASWELEPNWSSPSSLNVMGNFYYVDSNRVGSDTSASAFYNPQYTTTKRAFRPVVELKSNISMTYTNGVLSLGD